MVRHCEEAEREHILQILRETKGVVGGAQGAAARLGIKRTTLHAKMQRLGIRPSHRRHYFVTWQYVVVIERHRIGETGHPLRPHPLV